jgi:hypothetical protein
MHTNVLTQANDKIAPSYEVFNGNKAQSFIFPGPFFCNPNAFFMANGLTLFQWSVIVHAIVFSALTYKGKLLNE